MSRAAFALMVLNLGVCAARAEIDTSKMPAPYEPVAGQYLDCLVDKSDTVRLIADSNKKVTALMQACKAEMITYVLMCEYHYYHQTEAFCIRAAELVATWSLENQATHGKPDDWIPVPGQK
jgi:hypothetical protein